MVRTLDTASRSPARTARIRGVMAVTAAVAATGVGLVAAPEAQAHHGNCGLASEFSCREGGVRLAWNVGASEQSQWNRTYKDYQSNAHAFAGVSNLSRKKWDVAVRVGIQRCDRRADGSVGKCGPRNWGFWAKKTIRPAQSNMWSNENNEFSAPGINGYCMRSWAQMNARVGKSSYKTLAIVKQTHCRA